MADRLTEMYDAWRAANPEADDTAFTAFAAGFTASAVSMRARATAVVSATKLKNDAKNALLTGIGSLPDIPA